MANTESINLGNSSSCFNKDNGTKIANDIQIILDIALAVIICLGDGGLLSPVSMGSAMLGLAATKAIVALVSYVAEGKEKNSGCSSNLMNAVLVISLIASVVMGSLLIHGSFDPKVVALIALGVDLSAIAIRVVSTRTCGPNKKRYSCFQTKE